MQFFWGTKALRDNQVGPSHFIDYEIEGQERGHLAGGTPPLPEEEVGSWSSPSKHRWVHRVFMQRQYWAMAMGNSVGTLVKETVPSVPKEMENETWRQSWVLMTQWDLDPPTPKPRSQTPMPTGCMGTTNIRLVGTVAKWKVYTLVTREVSKKR